jgi:membrane protein implicated in regulation of membrane protease activity
MSKTVMVVLWFLVGLCLLAAGLTGMTTYTLDLAGILVIILAIVLLMKKKPEMKAAA